MEEGGGGDLRRVGANEFANITVKQEQMVSNFGVLRFNRALNYKQNYCDVAVKLVVKDT